MIGELVADLVGWLSSGLFASTRSAPGQPLPTGERIARQLVLWSFVIGLGMIGLIAVLVL